MKINFGRIMASLAMRYRENAAIVNVERNRRYTYLEYHRLTNRIANAIGGTLGLAKGDTALLMLDNDNLSVLHWPAILKQEATFAFSNQRDSQSEHARQLQYLRPKVAYIETRMVQQYYEALSGQCTIVVMDRAPGLPDDVLCFWDLVDAASDEETKVELDDRDHIPLLRFTGGTTGHGKCVGYSVDNLFACRDNAFLPNGIHYDEQTRFLSFTPLSHARIMLFIPTLFAGGTTYTLNAPDLTTWACVVEAEQITLALFVPTLLYRLLDMNVATSHSLSSLKVIVYGASPISPSALGRLIDQFGPIFVQGYAASETLQIVSILDQSDHNAIDAAGRKRLSSAGQISPDIELVIVDESGVVLPNGEVGELWLRGRATISGYFNNRDDTAMSLEQGFCKSGDLGYLDDDGYLFIVDRKKDMIITGGFNVYAVEVEAALAQHPGVLMSAAIGIPDETWGEAVHAEVVLRQGQTVSEKELISYVKESLGSYKAPRTIRFVEQLPVSPVGKVVRRIVREQYWTGRERGV